MIHRKTLVAAALALAAGACSAGGSNPMVRESIASNFLAGGRHAETSVLKLLTKHAVIGSTVDPVNGDPTPAGLTVATVTYKKIKKGDLYVCDFNNKANVPGTATTIESLSPATGSKPARFTQSPALLGCGALSGDGIGLWAAAYGAKSETHINELGKVDKAYKGGNYVAPYGTLTSVMGGLSAYPTTAVYTADATTGSIVLTKSCTPSYCSYPGIAIVTGFARTGGKPGSMLGPFALAFDQNALDPKLCSANPCGRLYVVDGANNTVVAIDNVQNLRKAKSIVVGPTGKTFSGPEASWARLFYAGKPLNGPRASAVLYGTATGQGNLVVANSLDAAGTNLLIEFSPSGKVLDSVNVDKGRAGALWGMAASPPNAATKQLFFSDDNANNVQVLEKP